MFTIKNYYGFVFVKKRSLGHIDVEAALENLISAVKDASLVNIPRVCEYIMQMWMNKSKVKVWLHMLMFKKNQRSSDK